MSVSQLFSKRPFITQNIFISSTFQDMQLERDYLKKRVLPIVKDYALRYRINIEIVDLRFGINIGQSSSLDKVVKTCREEIVRCQPMFVAFLGDRYGTKVGGASITEQEIRYAKELGCSCMFFLRDIEGAEKMSESKRSVYFLDTAAARALQSETENAVRYRATYDAKKGELRLQDDFVEVVSNSIMRLIDETYKTAENKYECAIASYIDYARFLHKDFIALSGESERRLQSALTAKEKIVVLYGMSGSGKSMLLSNLVCALIDKKTEVLPYAPAASGGNSGIVDMLNTFTQYLVSLNGEKYVYEPSEERVTAEFYRRLQALNVPLIIVCDEFEKYGDARIKWIKPESIPFNVKIVLSTTDANDVEAMRYDSTVIEIFGVEKAMIPNIVTGYVASHNIKLSESFFNRLCIALSKIPTVTVQHFIACLDYVFYNDRNDARAINALISPNDENATDNAVTAFYLKKIENIPVSLDSLLLSLLSKRLENLDTNLANMILAALAFSKVGVRESELEAIARKLRIAYVSSEFAFMRKSMQGYFVQDANGAWSFVHNQIKECFRAYYNRNAQNVKEALAAMLIRLPKNDENKYNGLIELLFEVGEIEKASEIILDAYYYNRPWLEECTDGLCKSMEVSMNALTDFVACAAQESTKLTLRYIAGFVVHKFKACAGVDGVVSIYNAIGDFFKDCEDAVYLDAVIMHNMIDVRRDAITAPEHDTAKSAREFELCTNEDAAKEMYATAHDMYSMVLDMCEVDDEMWLSIVAFYIEEAEYYLLRDTKQALTVLDTANMTIKAAECRDDKVYGMLAQVYLLYAQAHMYEGENQFINAYVSKVEKMLSEGKIPIDRYCGFLQIMLDIAHDFYARQDYARALVFFDKTSVISQNYRNEEKTFEAILVNLRIRTQRNLVRLKLEENVTQEEMDALQAEYDDFYAKSGDSRVRFYALDCEELIELSREDDYETYTAVCKGILDEKWAIAKKIGKEGETLVASALFMDGVHQYLYLRSTRDAHMRLSSFYEKIYNNTNAARTLLEKEAVRDITFSYALSLNDISLQRNLLAKVFDMSVKIYKTVKSPESLKKAVNECFFLCDCCCKMGDSAQAADALERAMEIVMYARDSFGYNEQYNIAKIRVYEIKCTAKDDSKKCMEKLPDAVDNIEMLDEDTAQRLWEMLADVMMTLREPAVTKENKRLFNALLEIFDKRFDGFSRANRLSYYEDVNEDETASEDENKNNTIADVAYEDREEHDVAAALYAEQVCANHAIDEDNEELVGRYASAADTAVKGDIDYLKLMKESVKQERKELNVLLKDIGDLRLSEDMRNDYEHAVNERGKAFWEKQIEMGYHIGYYYLGLQYEGSDEQKAIEYYRKGAEEGNLPCMNAIGYFLIRGGEVDEGYRYQLESAKGGYLPAIENILFSFRSRLNMIDGVYEQLLENCRRNLMTNEHDQANPNALKAAKLCIEYGNLDIENYPWFLRYYNLVSLENKDYGRIQMHVGANDANERELWLMAYQRMAVVEKDPEAMVRLSYYYLFGKFVDYNAEKALFWCRQAAKRGKYALCTPCGLALMFGAGTLDRDTHTAIQLLIYGAKDGNEDAENAIKEFYRSGAGTKKTNALIERSGILKESL